MSANYLVAKSIDPPETVTDPLNFANDEDFKAGDYRRMAAGLFENIVWRGESGTAQIGDFEVSLEPTDAGIFVQFASTNVPTDTIRSLVTAAMRLGAVVMSTTSGDFLSAN